MKQEKNNPKVKITMADGKEINLELYPEYAPVSVQNFLRLVDEKYYNNTVFHRIIANFMIQAGCFEIKDGRVISKPQVPTIKGEFASNGYKKNTLQHTLGTISMARTMVNNSASSQFFICSTSCPNLDGQYAAFGRTTDENSNKVVQDLSYSQTDKTDFPFPVVAIAKIDRV